MIIEILTQSLGDEAALSPDRLERIVPDVTEEKDSLKKIVIPEKFRSDIEALERYAAMKLESGLCITVSLAELCSVCPRKRRRTASYAALKEFLRDEMNVTLTIKTHKK